MITKAELRKKFAADWQKHYKIDFLQQQGFMRKICTNCGKGFWTLDNERKVCPDQPCSFYEFLGNPPTKKKMDYIESWKAIERFFVKNKHTLLRRYPVVCRWYPLYFTIAGIVDFYRIENGNLVFDFPANPTIVPQFCLRFNDIPNVGVTGKHYSCFVMVQQSSLYNGKTRGGYWKDKCIELDFKMLRDVFKIPPKEIVFLEDMWMGPAAYGASMEYFVRGLELGNAVFTEFGLRPDDTSFELPQKVIDMGAGLERLAWITQGTPTSYDVTFKPVVEYLKKQTGVDYDRDLFLRYSKLAGLLNFDEVSDIEAARTNIAKQLGVDAATLKKKIAPLEAIYAIADHTASLLFAISDGALPSNVGGGYNLRVILRRALAFLNEFGWNIDLTKIFELHASHLKRLAPELKENINQVNKIFDVEKQRYKATQTRAASIVEVLVKKKSVPEESKLIQLYESEGITPETIKTEFEKRGQKIDVPADFYVQLTEKHMSHKDEEEKVVDVSGLPPTKLLFYENERQTQFEARVLKIIDNKYVILNQTSFYGRSGGQEPDRGFLDGTHVIDVKKQGDVILHVVEAPPTFKMGDKVKGEIDWNRRFQLMQHHTATHIINATAREILGTHVWQNSAFKDIDHARLDITHYEALTDEQVKRIEQLANQIVSKNYPVKKTWLPRAKAEAKYGFRLYQGGAVPSKELRIVSTPVDVEACGGTHVDKTGEVGLINILRTKRIQDGAVRIEFAAGNVAIHYLKEKEKFLKETAAVLRISEAEVPVAVEKLFKEWKEKKKELKKLKGEVGR